VIGLLRRYLRPYSAPMALVVTLLVIQAVGNLWLPSLNADIINKGVLTGDVGYILQVGGVMLALALLLGVASITGVYYGSKVAMGFGRDVRSALFNQVERFSLRELNDFGAPSLITRTTNDVQQVQMLVLMGLTMLVLAPITAVGGVFMALRENVTLSGLLLVIVPVMMLIVGLVMRRAIPLFRSVQKKIDQINRVLRENLTGVRVIRAFVRTRHEEERFARANEDLTATTLAVNRLLALTMPSIMLVFNLSSVAILWFGGLLVDRGDMQIGDLTAFLSYIMQILMSVMMAVMMIAFIPRAAASGERIQAVLDVAPGIVDAPPDSAQPAPAGPGVVELRDVTFRYPGAEEPVLCGVSLRLEPGQTTAVVGSTGSGKTTLLNLLPRLYDVSEGAVLLDGVDVRHVRQDDLRAALGVVPQKAFLFNGTVASNVRIGRHEASDEEVWAALDVAQARDFVAAMPAGLEAPVEQGGANLSGGQRQRLAIARALVRRPRVYLFDDSFSALDAATDARLRAALWPVTREATVLIVAQRVSTILRADQIVVLDGGRVVGVGQHAELLTTCPTYAEIVSSQLSAEEAA
jgi:ATP-binding cassette subfamily B protein